MKTKWLDRVLAVILAVCLVVGLMPATALATSAGTDDTAIVSDEPSPQAEATVATENDLVEAVKTGGTVTLDDDITLAATLTIAESTTVILDLNGHTLTGNNDDTITNNGTLTIQGTGTVTNTVNGKTALLNNGTAALNGGTFIRTDVSGNSYYTVVNHGTMTVDGATISNTGSYASCVENGWNNIDDVNGVAELTVKSGTITGGLNAVKNDNSSVLYVEGGTIQNSVQYAIMNYGTATISGGEISCTVPDADVSTSKSGSAIYNHNSVDDSESTAQLNITGGTVTCNNHGVYNYSGNVIISGAAKVTGGVYAVYSAGGVEISGDAELSGGSSGISSTGSDAVLEISGGTITGKKYYGITLGESSSAVISGGTLISERTGSNAYVVRLTNASVEITGGTLGSSDSNNKATVYLTGGSTADISGGEFLGAENNIYVSSSGTNTATVTGGTFSSDVSQYVPEGYEYDGTTGEVIAATPVDTYVAEVNGTKYTTLTEAVAAVQANGTITLLADVTNEDYDKVIDINLPAEATLDGGGHTLEGNIKVTVNAAGGTIQNVKFKNIHNSEKKLSAVYGSSLSGTLKVTGCEFHNCDWDALQITPVANANIIITGNTFTTDNTDEIYQVRYVHIESKTNVDFSATVTENVMYDTIKGVNGAGLKCGALEIYYFTNPEKITTNMNYIEYPELNCILMNSGTNVGEMVYPMYATDDLNEDNLITPVAAIKTTYEGTYYTTLQEAINAAGNSDTVTLLADVTESVTIPDGKAVTLNLNGKTLTNEAGKDTITVALDAELTVTGNGTVDNVSHQMAAVVNNGTTTLNGGSYTRSQEASTSTEDANGNSYYNILNHGVMTINEGVSVTSTGAFSSLIDNGYYSYSSTNPRSGYVESVNQAEPSLTINGGTFSGGINTIKNDDAATVKITGGSFSNVTQHVVLNWNIASIEGGTFDSSNGASVTIQNNGDSNTINQGKLTITDGTFTASEGTSNLGGSGGTVAVSGGTFSSKVPEEYCAEGFEPTTEPNSDGKYTVEAVKVAQVKDAEGNVTQYATLDEAIEAVQPGGTITLLGNVTLADDTPAKIMDKGTADSPITLDLNGYIISGSNSKNGTNEDTTTPGGILWVYGSYVTLTDTSTSEEKGSIINTYAGSSAAYGLVIRSAESNVGAVTIDNGVRIEVTGSTSTSARAIHFQNNTNTSGTLTLTIEDAKVTANKGHTVYASGSNGMVTINGGEFASTGKANNAVNFNGSSTNMTIKGGTFYNWSNTAWNEVAKDHVICIAQPEGSDTFTVTVAAQAPDDYVALVDSTDVYRAICLTEGSDLYVIHNVQPPAGRTIHVKKSVSYTFPDGTYYGYNASDDPGSYLLTLDLAEGVTLSGGMNLYSADVTVTGEGALSNDFTWTPAEGYGMTANGETDGLYSCRLTTGAQAELIKADGTTVLYKTIVSAITAARLSPGSTAKMLADYTNSLAVTVNEYNGVVADFTLDLNGHTYTYSGVTQAITVNDGAKLIVTDSSENGGGAIVTESTRGNANAALATTGTGGTIIIEESATVKNLVLLDAPNSKLTVAGTIDTTGFETYAISGNGSTGKGGTEITIKETAVIISDPTVAAPAIYHPQSGTLNVEGGEISGYGGIQMCSGNLVITGDPTITATGSDDTANKTGDGGIPDGVAISIVNRGYPGGTPTATITGTPTVIATTGVEAVQAYTWSDNAESDWTEAGNYVNISGGTYSTEPEKTLLATGYVADYKAMDSGYVVEPGGEAFNTETKTYGTLADMLKNAESGQTVQLLTDVTAEDVVSVESGITLDLNGHVLTASNGLKGRVIDSSDGDGQLICDSNSLSLSADSEYLPIYDSTFGCYRLYKYGLESATKAVAADNGDRVTFYFRLNLKQKTAYDLLAQGNSGVSVKVKVDWTEKNVNQSLIVELNQQTFSSAQSIANNSGAERVVLYVAVTGVRGLVSDTTVSGTPKISVDRWDGDKQSDAIEYEVLSDGTSDETDEGE